VRIALGGQESKAETNGLLQQKGFWATIWWDGPG